MREAIICAMFRSQISRGELRVDKKRNKFSIKMQKKLVVLFGLVLLAFTGLSIRLIWLTRENGTRYQKQVLAQQQ